MLKFYFNTGPNPTKVALMLEELGLDYEPVPVDTRRGEQHRPEYLALNPNAKAPTIDDDGVVVFDSNAILLYLAEKTGKFLPGDSPAERAQLLSWLMFVASGVGPYFGQSVHFRTATPEPVPYAVRRYSFEARRHAKILDGRLASAPYILGDAYTIVDIAAWGWSRMVPRVLGDDGWEGLSNLKRLVDEISARPAAGKALEIIGSHTFKTDMDEEAKRAMFPSNYAPAN